MNVDTVSHYTANDAQWPAYLDHLRRVKMFSSALKDGQPKPDCTYLGVTNGADVIGHIAIRRQPLIIPASDLTSGDELPLTLDGELLYEAFVQSFAVEEDYQRRGYGRALQQHAMTVAQGQGCYQLRSWSSADKDANYALKLSLGFAVHPALYPLPGGRPLSGVYFIRRLHHPPQR